MNAADSAAAAAAATATPMGVRIRERKIGISMGTMGPEIPFIATEQSNRQQPQPPQIEPPVPQSAAPVNNSIPTPIAFESVTMWLATDVPNATHHLKDLAKKNSDCVSSLYRRSFIVSWPWLIFKILI